jgi:hypothetical protein
MKTSVTLVATLMAIAGSIAQPGNTAMGQGLGFQRMTDPSNPRHSHMHHMAGHHTHGVRIPLPPNNLGFPGCSDIQSVGSPILLTYQAQLLIDSAMNPQAQGTFVRFIFYSQENGPSAFSRYFKLIFEIRDQSQAHYVGIMFDNPANGIGSTKFLKFILTQSLEIARKVLKITAPMPALAFTCGDLKAIYSTYGNDPRSAIPSNYPGFNRNGVPPAILKALKQLVAVRTPETTPGSTTRDCSASRFVKSTAYYTPNNSQLDNGNVPTNRNPFLEARCNPTGGPIIKTLNIVCKFFTCGPTKGEGEIYAIQAVFNVPFTQNVETTTFIGQENPPTPPNTAIATWNIDLSNASKIETFYPLGSANWYGIVVTLSNGTKNQFNCGSIGTPIVTAGQQLRDSIDVKDLLGFWGGKTGNLENANNPFDYLGFVKYV